jgi:hypothetical protein
MEEPDVEVGEQGIQELGQLGLVVVCTLRYPHLDNRHIKESGFRGRMPIFTFIILIPKVNAHRYYKNLHPRNQCCGSESGIRCLFDPWIRDPVPF